MDSSNDIFLSIVIVAENQCQTLEQTLRATGDAANRCSQDHEIVVVENGSEDGSVELLKSLCSDDGIPNLQVYVLTKKTESDIAAWAGVANALGDYVAVINPMNDDIESLPSMLTVAMGEVDVVFAANSNTATTSIPYRVASSLFGALVSRLLGIDINSEMPFYRVLSRRVVNYMLEHSESGLAYRWLPAFSGFNKASITYNTKVQPARRGLIREVDRGIRMLVSSTAGPMRIVTLLSFFGAVMNLLYSGYVIGVALFKEDVAAGWVTLSLQQSGMFFLISLVLLILGEYILHMVQLATNAPSYYIANEYTSARITRHSRLNVEAISTVDGLTHDLDHFATGHHDH